MLSFYEWLIQSFGAEKALMKLISESAVTKEEIIMGVQKSDALLCYLVYTWDCDIDARKQY